MATAQQTASQARAGVDPVLSAVARGYRSVFAPVADILFPRVTVSQRGGQILSFNRDDFRLVNSRRQFGANTMRVQYGFTKENFSLVDYRLEGSVPKELWREAKVAPGLDLLERAVNQVQDTQDRERESQAATLATTAANYAAANKITLAGNDRWDVVHADSDPFTDINVGKEAIRQAIGQRPNVLTLGPTVLTALRSNPKVLDRISTATDRPPASLAQLAALFEIERVVEGNATYFTGTAFADIWGKFALLAFTTPASAASYGSPNFGYTYQLEGYPEVEEAYLDRNPNTWATPVADARQVVLVGPDAGYLITTAVS